MPKSDGEFLCESPAEARLARSGRTSKKNHSEGIQVDQPQRRYANTHEGKNKTQRTDWRQQDLDQLFVLRKALLYKHTATNSLSDPAQKSSWNQTKRMDETEFEEWPATEKRGIMGNSLSDLSHNPSISTAGSVNWSAANGGSPLSSLSPSRPALSSAGPSRFSWYTW